MTLQLIDEHKTFNANVGRFFDELDLIPAGLDYHVVSVFGSQSTGKSTLLNALFGTRFDVMDSHDRRQTTKGIWMAKAARSPPPDSPDSSDSFEDLAGAPQTVRPRRRSVPDSHAPVLVLDVEGADGRERGEDQDFERKAALFALATSEVLIVNMWENQVGLFQGANMGLLKTVFEVNLALFHGKEERQGTGSDNAEKHTRSCILFVIRDHIGTTPLLNLAATVRADLDTLWAGLAKPKHLENGTLSDFFDVAFEALPHKLLQPDQFAAQTQALAARFSEPDSPGYVFQPVYHRKVPLDGWSMYAQNVWTQIELNKDLDLPTQHVLVGRFRCSEIAQAALITFTESLAPLDSGSAGGTVVSDDLGPAVARITSRLLADYDAQASRYAGAVYQTQRSELEAKADALVADLLRAQLRARIDLTLQEFDEAVTNATTSTSFGQVLQDCRAQAFARFEASAKVTVQNDSHPLLAQHIGRFTELLDAKVAQRLARQLDVVVSRVSKRVQKALDSELDAIFSDPAPDCWDRVVKLLDSAVAEALAPFRTSGGEIDFGVGASPAQTASSTHRIRARAWAALDARLKQLCSPSNVVVVLQDQFDRQFRFDRRGVPVVWKAGDDIDKPYVRARDHVLDTVLPVFVEARLSSGELIVPDAMEVVEQTDDKEDTDKSEGDSQFAVRLTPTQTADIVSRFRRLADAAFVDAKRSTTALATQVPMYMIVLVVVLGWNEFMAVVRNPLLFVFVLMASGGLYITHQLNLWGPIAAVSGAVVNKTLEVSKDRLRQVLEVGAGSVPVASGASTVPVHQRAMPGQFGDIELSELKPSSDNEPKRD